MKKSIRFILVLCLFVSGALSYAHGVISEENGKNEGTPVELVKKGGNEGLERDFFVSSELDGHSLTVSFATNMGQATVEVATAAGVLVDRVSTATPNDVLIYIASSGDYIVTIILSNGDEYYGEFEITE